MKKKTLTLTQSTVFSFILPVGRLGTDGIGSGFAGFCASSSALVPQICKISTQFYIFTVRMTFKWEMTISLCFNTKKKEGEENSINFLTFKHKPFPSRL